MAKVSFIQIPAGSELLFKKALCSGDRFTFSRIRQNRYFTTRKTRKGFTAKSMFPEISLSWNELDSGVKSAWQSAGQVMGLDGYKAFTRDKSLRIKNDLAGVATPSILHQDLVGGVHIESPANKIKIAQFHPQSYWVSAPVSGHKGMREPVKIIEDFALPLDLEVSYSCNLSASGANPYARLYAIVYSLYQGTTIENLCTIDFELVSDWVSVSASISSVIGFPKSYTLFLELNDVRGDFFFDNLIVRHSAQNWARDNFCNDIDQAFTRAFYQVPKHWVAVDISSGASFGSLYNS